MSERIQIPFAELGALQQKADEAWQKAHSSCLHGQRDLTVLSGAIDEQLARANAIESEYGPITHSVTVAAREKLQSAHRECSDQFIDRWVDDIATRVIDLRYSSPSLTIEERVAKIRDIRGNILELREQYTLGNENRKYLRFAENLLQQLEKGNFEPRPIRLSESFTVDAPNPQLAETYCEISHLFYLDKTAEALHELEMLPKEEVQEMLALARSVGGSLEALQDEDEEVFLSASIAFSRACLARANAYADNDEGMPDIGDIALLFDDGFDLDNSSDF